ncbi:MAG: putative metalloprotease CJM1_0395 family protein [Nitrospinaceae bacterium]
MEIRFNPAISILLPAVQADGSRKLPDEHAGGSEAEDVADRVTLSSDSSQGIALADVDRVTLSGVPGAEGSSHTPGEEDESGTDETGSVTNAVPGAGQELSKEERQVLEQLRARDREVRAHEQAHLAVAGGYARGGPKFEYQTGPDGKRYAVGGEVSIDTSKVPGDPQATLVKAQVIRRAANAPRNPSAQDRQVAAQATRLETEARRELAEQRTEEAEEAREKTESSTSALTGPQGSGNTDESGEQNSGNDTDASTRRAIRQFTPDLTTAGDLLNVIS